MSPSGKALFIAPSSRRWCRSSLPVLRDARVSRDVAVQGANDDDHDYDDNHCSSATFEVPLAGAGMRLDRFLSDVVSDQSRTYLAALCVSGHVTLVSGTGEVLTKKSHRVSPGDIIEVAFVLNEALEIVPENIPLDILYEVRHLDGPQMLLRCALHRTGVSLVLTRPCSG
jgi:ribosomal 50S subunit-recycling heat shock protein